MKKSFLLIICSMLLMLSACYDRELIDQKEGDPIDPVTNLAYSIDNTDVTLSWTLPTQYPSDIIQPVSVVLYVYRNSTLINTFTVPEAPITYIYDSYDSNYVYRIVVKVQGDVDTDDTNQSALRLSAGVTVEF